MDTNDLRRRMEGSSEGFLQSSAYVAWEPDDDGSGGIAHADVDGRPFVPVFTDPADVERAVPNARPRIMPMRDLVQDMPAEWGIVYDPTRDDATLFIHAEELAGLRTRLADLTPSIDDRRNGMNGSAIDFLRGEAYVPVDDERNVLTVRTPGGYSSVPVYCDPTDIGRKGAGARLTPMQHLVLTMPTDWGIVFEPDLDQWRRDIDPDFVAALRRVANGEDVDTVIGNTSEDLRAARERILSGPAGFLESTLYVGLDDEGLLIREVDEDGRNIVVAFASENDVASRYSGGTTQQGDVLIAGTAQAWNGARLVNALPEDHTIAFDAGRPSEVMCDPAYVAQLRDLSEPFPAGLETTVDAAPPSLRASVQQHMRQGAAAVTGPVRLWALAVTKRTFTEPQLLFVVEAKGDALVAVSDLVTTPLPPRDSAPVALLATSEVPRAVRKVLKHVTPMVDHR